MKGSRTWPFDARSARGIDEVIRKLIIEANPEQAADSTEAIQFDAFMSMLSRLYGAYREDCYGYILALAKRHMDPDLSRNRMLPHLLISSPSILSAGSLMLAPTSGLPRIKRLSPTIAPHRALHFGRPASSREGRLHVRLSLDQTERLFPEPMPRRHEHPNPGSPKLESTTL
jgi:hypothetical protein